MKNIYTNSQTAISDIQYPKSEINKAHPFSTINLLRLPALRVLLILVMMVGVGNVGWGQTVIDNTATGTSRKLSSANDGYQSDSVVNTPRGTA